MATYTKINKDISTYTKIDKAATEKGWFKQGWFSNWLKGIMYRKVEKEISTYTKIEKEI